MSKLGPIPSPEKKRNVTPIRTGKSVLETPGNTLGVKPTQQTVAPGTAGPPKGAPSAPATPTVSVGRLFVGKAPPSSSTGATSPDANPAAVTVSVQPESTARKGGARLGQIIATPQVQAAHALAGPVKFAPQHLGPYAPQDRSGIAIVGRFEPFPWGEVPAEMRLADALESLGVKVCRLDQYFADSPPLQAAWALFTDDHFSWGRLAEWSRTHPTILWSQEWMGDRPEKRTCIQAANWAKLFVTADRFDWARVFGIRHHFYLPGACDPEEPPFAPLPTRPCAYIGPLFTRRHRAAADVVRRFGGEVLDQEKARPYGPALARYVQETKVVVFEHPRNDVSGYRSNDLYTILGSGGFLLSSEADGIRDEFHPGTHLILYDSPHTLEQALKNYLSNDPVREGIRKVGFWHVRNHFTWINRARALLARLRLVPVEVKV